MIKILYKYKIKHRFRLIVHLNMHTHQAFNFIFRLILDRFYRKGEVDIRYRKKKEIYNKANIKLTMYLLTYIHTLYVYYSLY